MFLANICYGSVKGECRKGWEGMFMGGREWMPSENKSVFFNFKEAMSRGRSESHPCIYNALTAQWNRWAPKCPELTGPVRAPGPCRPHPASSLSLLSGVCQWEWLRGWRLGWATVPAKSRSSCWAAPPGERKTKGKFLRCLQSLEELLLDIQMDCSRENS